MLQFLVALLGLVQVTQQSLSFTYILHQKPMCFFETLPQDVVIAFQVIANTTEFSFKVEVLVTQEVQKKTKKAYQELYSVNKTILIRYTYTTVDKKSEIRYCLTPNGDFYTKAEIIYKIGSETNDYSAIANKENLNQVEVELKKLMDLEVDIKREKSFIIEREQQREQYHSGISKHIISYGLMSLGLFFILSYFTMNQIRKIIIAKKVN